mgnify:FL=1
MADGNANVLTPEPIFYGDLTGKTMAPEDFLRKMENIKGSTTPPMADEAAVKKAVSYLRGWAADWWCDSIELTMPERKEAARTNWNEFVALFKETFFAVAGLGDVPSDFAQLHQMPGEPMSYLFGRVTKAIITMSRLWPDYEDMQTPAERAVTNTALQAHIDQLGNNLWAGSTQAWKTGLATIITASATNDTKNMKNKIFKAEAVKQTVQATNSPFWKEKLCQWQREQKTLGEITALIKAQAAGADVLLHTLLELTA